MVYRNTYIIIFHFLQSSWFFICVQSSLIVLACISENYEDKKKMYAKKKTSKCLCCCHSNIFASTVYTGITVSHVHTTVWSSVGSVLFTKHPAIHPQIMSRCHTVICSTSRLHELLSSSVKTRPISCYCDYCTYNRCLNTNDMDLFQFQTLVCVLFVWAVHYTLMGINLQKQCMSLTQLGMWPHKTKQNDLMVQYNLTAISWCKKFLSWC